MAVTYGFYNSLNKDRVYNAEQMSSIFNGVITDGVFSTIGNTFTTVAGTGLQVIVKPGKAWFDGTWTLNDALLPLDIATADVSLDRIDAIILEVNSSASVRANSIKVLKGTASANPVKPTLTNTETVHQYALAYVTIAAGATSITAGNIEINVGKSTCPFVTSVLQQTNIDQLFAQWEYEFDTWFANVQSQLSGDIAANLQRQIDAVKNTADSNAASIAEVKKNYGLKIDDILLTVNDNPGEEFAPCDGSAIDDYEGNKLPPGNYIINSADTESEISLRSSDFHINYCNNKYIILRSRKYDSKRYYAYVYLIDDIKNKLFSENSIMLKSDNETYINALYWSNIMSIGYLDNYYILMCFPYSDTATMYAFTNLNQPANYTKSISITTSGYSFTFTGVVNGIIMALQVHSSDSSTAPINHHMYLHRMTSPSGNFSKETIQINYSRNISSPSIMYYSGYYIMYDTTSPVAFSTDLVTWQNIETSNVFNSLTIYKNELYAILVDSETAYIRVVKITNVQSMTYEIVASASNVYQQPSTLYSSYSYTLYPIGDKWIIGLSGDYGVQSMFALSDANDTAKKLDLSFENYKSSPINLICKPICLENGFAAPTVLGHISSNGRSNVNSIGIMTSELYGLPTISIDHAKAFIKIKNLETVP